ncbi:MAG: tetratricopeptide repeat protein [Candidatus Heimdallarchaeota archaeon]|nr:tetratricopeptide repeat protein [Candidatus Heimdallarchaeota archaeon]
MDIQPGRNLFESGKFDEAMTWLNNIQLDIITSQDFKEYYSLKVDIYKRRGQYDKCLGLLDKLESYADLLMDKYYKIEIMVDKCDIYWRWDKLKDLWNTVIFAESLLFETKEYHSEPFIRLFSLLKFMKGAYYRYISDLDIAFEYFEESLAWSSLIEDQALVAQSINAVALTQKDRGDYEDALKNFQKAKELRMQLDNELDLAITLYNMSGIYMNQGEMDLALNYLIHSKEIAENKKCTRTLALVANGLGLYYNKVNNPDLAYQYLNESFSRFQELNNDHYTAQIIFEIIRVYSLNNNFDVIPPLLDHLEQIHLSNDSTITKLRYELSWASYHKHGNRMYLRAQAQSIFKEIAYGEIFDYSLFVYAVLNLTNMLLTELKFTTNKEVLDELFEIMKLLRTEHQHNSSHSLLIESFILEAKLARLEFNFDYSYEILNKAYELSLEKRLTDMQKKISGEYDILLEEFQHKTINEIDDMTLFERLENAELEEYIANLLQSRVDESKMVQDNPLLIILVDEETQVVYSYPLNEEVAIQEDYINSILHAINLFLSEMLKRKEDKLERLKHGTSYVLIRRLLNLKVIYCFESEASFAGVERFNLFLNLLEKIQFKEFLENENARLQEFEPFLSAVNEVF